VVLVLLEVQRLLRLIVPRQNRTMMTLHPLCRPFRKIYLKQMTSIRLSHPLCRALICDSCIQVTDGPTFKSRSKRLKAIPPLQNRRNCLGSRIGLNVCQKLSMQMR
jgi:hypothetical protein